MIKIAVTIDQEWCPVEVTDWLMQEFDKYGVKATFFATDHPKIDFGPHEIALHPNAFRTGAFDLYGEIEKLSEMYPQAVGIRMHRLFWDSIIEKFFQSGQFQYASNFMIPNQLVQPFKLGSKVIHFPVFYMDHHEMINLDLYQNNFSLQSQNFKNDGLYVFDFHPNLLFANAYSNQFYDDAIRPVYQDYKGLKEIKHTKRGCLDLFRDLLSLNGKQGYQFVTLAEEVKNYRS